jgi:hypothetical protein
MEIDETPVQPAAPEPQLILTEEAQYYLQKAGEWAYFLGIIGFILSGLILLIALFIGTILSAISQFQPNNSGMNPAAMGGMLTVVYGLIAVFYFFFSLYIYQFGNRIKKGIVFSNTEEITLALSKLKSFFKLWGISTIVIMGLYALIIVFAIIGGAAGMMGR